MPHGGRGLRFLERTLRNDATSSVEATAKPRLLLAIEDRWRRRGLEQFLVSNGFRVVARVPSLVITEVVGSMEDAYDALLRVQAQWPNAPILAFVPEMRVGYILPCLGAGANGVLHANTDPATLLAAIRSVLQGNIWAPRNLMARGISRLMRPEVAAGTSGGTSAFTRAERRVLRALRDELSNKEIGRLLNLSEATVKFHISRLLSKTRTANRHELREFFSRANRRPQPEQPR